ncbi:Rnase H [Bacillus phage Eldridge]|uniref:RNase H n=1 Tax=Bacillus phage Eldridge TaxID=1776293 RepID=A0A0Y0ACF6_9CAUD|nr:Rnase H [Bacillus phage Eldridge]AMB18612.1 RNase H [Bacillus phage Eldridge]
MRLYLDTEFTGLHQHTTLISIGIKAANGKKFYAESTTYDPNQVDDWIKDNVIDNLIFNGTEDFTQHLGDHTYVKGPEDVIAVQLAKWLTQFNQVEIWSDCLAYDLVLFNQLFGGALSVPDCVYYIYYDICTLFKMFGIDPDISREAFIDKPIKGVKHSALYDAEVIEACYDKLVRNKDLYPFKLESN